VKAEMVYCDAAGCQATERLTAAHNWITVQGMGASRTTVRHYCADHTPPPIKTFFGIRTAAEYEAAAIAPLTPNTHKPANLPT
jgi:hypothetical protein